MYDGFSPKAFRRTKMLLDRLPSSTNVSGQTLLMSSSLPNKRPLFRTKSSRVSNAFGVSSTISLSRNNLRSAGSKRKGPNS
jgi:hypothetical protein